MSSKPKAAHFKDEKHLYDKPAPAESAKYTIESWNGKGKIYSCGCPQYFERPPWPERVGIPTPKVIDHACDACEKAPLEERMKYNNEWLIANVVEFYRSEDAVGTARSAAKKVFKKDGKIDGKHTREELINFCHREAKRLEGRKLSFLARYQEAQINLTAKFTERCGTSRPWDPLFDWPFYYDDEVILQHAFTHMLHREEAGVSPHGRDRARVEKGKKPKSIGDGDGDVGKLTPVQKADNDAMTDA